MKLTLVLVNLLAVVVHCLAPNHLRCKYASVVVLTSLSLPGTGRMGHPWLLLRPQLPQLPWLLSGWMLVVDAVKLVVAFFQLSPHHWSQIDQEVGVAVVAVA